MTKRWVISVAIMVIMILTTMLSACGGSTYTPADLTLEVLSPADESVVRTEEIEVVGSTLPSAMASVNGILTSINEDGAFSTRVALKQGPNIIEVVASDVSGNELGEILTVIYIP